MLPERIRQADPIHTEESGRTLLCLIIAAALRCVSLNQDIIIEATHAKNSDSYKASKQYRPALKH